MQAGVDERSQGHQLTPSAAALAAAAASPAPAALAAAAAERAEEAAAAALAAAAAAPLVPAAQHLGASLDAVVECTWYTNMMILLRCSSKLWHSASVMHV